MNHLFYVCKLSEYLLKALWCLIGRLLNAMSVFAFGQSVHLQSCSIKENFCFVLFLIGGILKFVSLVLFLSEMTPGVGYMYSAYICMQKVNGLTFPQVDFLKLHG